MLTTLVDTLLIVMVVIFLFLGSYRSVLIPIVAIPVSLIGGVFLMQSMGFTINLLTLLAIVLSVGLVVDDAIVVVENVQRHLNEGQSPLDAALLGARELVGPVIAMTVTLAAVYAPIGLQGGLTGALFREFAFTLAGAVIISGVVALTLSPMMSPNMLKPGLSEHGLAGRIERDFKKFKEHLRPAARQNARCPPRRVSGVARAEPCGHTHVYHVACRACTQGGSGRHFQHYRGPCKLNAGADQRILPPRSDKIFQSIPENGFYLRDHVPDKRLSAG